MDEAKLLRMLGMCAKAGKLVSGGEAVQIAVKKGSAKLVIMDAGMSAGSSDKLESLCAGKVGLIKTGGDLGRAIGKQGRMCAAVTDKGFAATLLDISTH